MIHYTAAMLIVSGSAVLADMTDHRTATIALLILWAFMVVMLIVAKLMAWVFDRSIEKSSAKFSEKLRKEREDFARKIVGDR